MSYNKKKIEYIIIISRIYYNIYNLVGILININ